MPRKIDLSEIAKKNPHFDLKALEEGRKLRENLREFATKRHHGWASKRQVRIDDDISSDPRVVRLRQSLPR